MPANQGTIDSAATVTTNASPFFISSRTDILRYNIYALSQLAAGLMPATNPTVAQIGAVLGPYRPEQAENELWAILLQILVNLLGGAQASASNTVGGFGVVRAGTAANPNGACYGNVSDVYVSSAGSIYVKTSGNGTNTGWTFKV
jgi:hypothetical protein